MLEPELTEVPFFHNLHNRCEGVLLIQFYLPYFFPMALNLASY
jgi:hypothetical protein